MPAADPSEHLGGTRAREIEFAIEGGQLNWEYAATGAGQRDCGEASTATIMLKANHAAPSLRVAKIAWADDGWPVSAGP